ncbi:hypothetical protein ACRAKI_27510 [Saccharothrix isguenensis]
MIGPTPDPPPPAGRALRDVALTKVGTAVLFRVNHAARPAAPRYNGSARRVRAVRTPPEGGVAVVDLTVREVFAGDVQRHQAFALLLPPGNVAPFVEDNVLEAAGLRDFRGAIEAFTTLSARHYPDGLPAHCYGSYACVVPRAQRQGLGERRIRAVLDRCAEAGIGVHAEATSSRDPAPYLRCCLCRAGAPIALPHGPDLRPVWCRPASSPA